MVAVAATLTRPLLRTVLFGNSSDTFVLVFDSVPHDERAGGYTSWRLILHRDGTFILDFLSAIGDAGKHTVGWQELGAVQYQMLCHGSGATSCHICPAGSYCTLGSSIPLPCAGGSYNPHPGLQRFPLTH